MYKYVLAAFLMLGLYVFSSGEADARVCAKWVGGTCVLWTGSVECVISANQLGNITKDPKSVSCTIEPLEPGGSIRGLVLCDSPGTKRHFSPGQQLTFFQGDLEAIAAITSIGKNGVAVTTTTATASGEDLAQLNGACQNPNWTAFDFVPCEMRATVAVVDDTGTLSTLTSNCSVPNCETLQWDRVTQTIERREYDCPDFP